MATIDYRNHARARPLQTVLFRAFGRSEPALEGLTRGHVVQGIIEERERGLKPGLSSLISASARKLWEREGGKDRWSYTRKHSAEVAHIAYVTAKEAERHELNESIEAEPELCFVGGSVHDIGKTLLPLTLIVKELGTTILGIHILENSPMTDIERRVLRDEHISAGTRYIRLFGGDGQVKTILNMTGLHHVMYNGQDSLAPSYPGLFKGIDLPFHVRIAKTADFLSAVLPRHYRKDSWIHSFRDSVAYALTVSGRELDPLAVSCFLTGCYDVSLEEATWMAEHFRHPQGQDGISNIRLIKEHVNGVVKTNREFKELIRRLDPDKIAAYYNETRALARQFGFPAVSNLPMLEH